LRRAAAFKSSFPTTACQPPAETGLRPRRNAAFMRQRHTGESEYCLALTGLAPGSSVPLLPSRVTRFVLTRNAELQTRNSLGASSRRLRRLVKEPAPLRPVISLHAGGTTPRWRRLTERFPRSS